MDKSLLRKNFLLKRKKKYYEINEKFFNPLFQLIKKKYKSKKINLSLYYPTFSEVNVFAIFKNKQASHFKFLLPIIEQNNSMNFHRWKIGDVLTVNKFGIPEPLRTKSIIPDIVLVPLISFDRAKNRLGYGKGYYDRFFNKYLERKKNILTIGVAFYFQKYHKLPKTKTDVQLDKIITEKGIF